VARAVTDVTLTPQTVALIGTLMTGLIAAIGALSGVIAILYRQVLAERDRLLDERNRVLEERDARLVERVDEPKPETKDVTPAATSLSESEAGPLPPASDKRRPEPEEPLAPADQAQAGYLDKMTRAEESRPNPRGRRL